MADGSLLDRLRAQRERQLQRKTLTLRVPGWGEAPDAPSVYARYRPIPWEDMAALVLAGDDPQAALGANCDALIAACDAILVEDADDGEPRSLAAILREQGEDVPGEVRFDEVACDVLAIEASSARETVLGVFSGAVSPEVAIAEHAARIGTWMRGTTQEVDEALLGE